MKKSLMFSCAILWVFVFVGISNAALIIQGDFVYDDAAELWWWRDFKTFAYTGSPGSTYSQQISQIESFTAGLSSDWHMAKFPQIQSLFDNNPMQDVANSFITNYPFAYWVGRIDEVSSSSYHYVASINSSYIGSYNLSQSNDGSSGQYGPSAWVYTETNPVPVPEPATMLLLGSGLVGLAGFTRKFRKRS